MTGADWSDPSALAIALYLDGSDDPDRAADGTLLLDDDFLVLVNAWWEPLDFVLPDTRPEAAWQVEIDTYDPGAAGRIGGGPPQGRRPRHRRPALGRGAAEHGLVHVNEDQILQQDHCHPQHGGDRRGDQQRAAGQMRRAPCRPGVIYEQDDRDDQRDVRGGRSRGAGQPASHQGQQRHERGGHHRPAGGQAGPYVRPGGQVAAFGVLPWEFGILLGNPVHEQGDQYRDHQGTCGYLVLDGGDDRRRDHGSVDPGRPAAAGIDTLEPLLLSLPALPALPPDKHILYRDGGRHSRRMTRTGGDADGMKA